MYINSSKTHRELPIYTHINSLESEHDVRDHIRKLLGSFEIEGPHGKHICLISEPLGISFDELKDKQSLTFMRKMLKWRPEDRGNCQEVFFDEWLLADLIESGQIVREEG